MKMLLKFFGGTILKKDVKLFVSTCSVWLAKSIQTATMPFQKITVDICNPFIKTVKSNLYIVVNVDYLPYWPEAYAILNKQVDNVSMYL